MKKIAFVFFILLFMLFVSELVVAQELPSPGILPDNFFYGVKRWWEGAQLWFKFDPVDKAKFHSYLAEVRLAEAKAMADSGKSQYIQGLMNDYESEINTTENILETQETTGRNVTDIEETVANATHKHLAILENLLEKVPEPAKIHIEHAINASSKGCLRALKAIRRHSPEITSKLAARFAEADLNRSKILIEKIKVKLAQRRLELYKKFLNETGEANEKAEKLGKNVTALAEHVCSKIYKHIEVLERVLEKAPDQAKPALEHAINASMKSYEKCMERITKAINRTVERWKWKNCTADIDCAKLLRYCPVKFGFKPTCYIPPNKTTGRCYCQPMWKRISRNCTTDADCRHLICPMVIGHDTPICKEGRCICGSRWEITNQTEWRERFNQTFSNETQTILRKIKERYLTTRINEITEKISGISH